MKKGILIILWIIFASGCGDSTSLDFWPTDVPTDPTDPTDPTPTATVTGIYVASYLDDVIYKYTSTGDLDDVLYQAQIGENISGLVKFDDENVLIQIDAGSERVEKLNLLTKTVSLYASDLQFVGVTRKLFYDPISTILFAPEGNTIEKFINGTRINASVNAFLLYAVGVTALNAPQKALRLSSEDIVVLNTGAVTLEISMYNSSGAYIRQVAMPAVDGNGEPYDVIEKEDNSGFLVAYYTTAISRIASFDMNGGAGAVMFQDQPGVKDCTNPAVMTFRPNGNLLVFCASEFYVAEIDLIGNIVGTVINSNSLISQMVEYE